MVTTLAQPKQQQQQQQAAPSLLTRRAGLLAAAALLAAAVPATTTPPPALAAPSTAPQLCVESETADEAGDCRRAALARDDGARQSYASAKQRGSDAATELKPVAGTNPVAKLDSAYVRDTQQLGDKIRAYVSVPADDARARAPLVKSLRADCQQWASKYARGGSARSQSARSMYVAVDAVMGHLASNGVAPLPSNKLKEVGASLEASAAFLDEGR